MGMIVNCDGDDPLRFTEEALDELRGERDALAKRVEELIEQTNILNAQVTGGRKRVEELEATIRNNIEDYSRSLRRLDQADMPGGFP